MSRMMLRSLRPKESLDPFASYYAAETDTLTTAFGARGTAHWQMGRPVPVSDPQEKFASLMRGRGHGKCSVYVHIPFCLNHCLFCGFYRNRANEAEIHAYVMRLCEEIDREAATYPSAYPIHTVYLGGGTPSAISAEDLHLLIRTIRDALPLAPDCEFTVEGRVYAFTREKVLACIEAGANRFSIGVQSFDTKLRQRMGRKCEQAEVIDFMQALARDDRAVSVCDLIYGLPGQTMESWRQDLAICRDLMIDGVDLYGLSMFKGGPLSKSIEKGSLPPAADLPEMARRYALGVEMLTDAGWRHVTQAHFARTTRERNLYNQYSKTGANCMAFGCGAGGTLNGHRYMLEMSIEQYGKRLKAGEKPITMMFAASDQAQLRSRISSTLESGTLNFTKLGRDDGPAIMADLMPLLSQWERAGLVRLGENAMHLTTSGWFWHSRLSDALVEIISAPAQTEDKNSGRGASDISGSHIAAEGSKCPFHRLWAGTAKAKNN